MASLPECESAVQSLVARLAALDVEVRGRYLVDRTVSLRITDLHVVFVGQLCESGLCEVRQADDASAQVRLAVSSDDLLALSEGQLAVPVAWATGRLKIDASLADLLKLSTLR